MLLNLSVKNFILVDSTELEFNPGFTVLTGETGAGKSILIDALSFLLGERADAGVVRAGCDRAELAAEFDIKDSPNVVRWLEENELQGDTGMYLVRRIIDSTGRSRAFINGHSATLQQLREAGEWLVDIHGQHAHQSLLRPAAQRDLLDAYGGLATKVAELVEAYQAWRQTQRRLQELEQNADGIAREREQLEWQISELSALKFTPEEWNELQSEHSRLAHGASLVEGVQQAVEILAETDNACLSQLGGVLSKLNQLRDYDAGLGNVLSILEPAEIQLQEGIHELRHYLQGLDMDPERLKHCEQRLDDIHSTARKYRVMPAQLPDLLSDWQSRLDELGSALDLEELADQERSQRQQYESLANKISGGRKKAAKELSQKVSAAMQDLAMSGGVFEVALNSLEQGNAHGLEQTEFLVSAHSGTGPKPLGKVASGGELSRISLAIQVATSQVAPVPTLIFDEVDVGIGGGVAEIVGQMLKQLGSEYQVLCITHLPQVAALGNQHWVVSKQQVNGSVSSRIQMLDKDQRIDEIARMLGGIEITHKTRDHAAEMLGNT